ncbi:oligosaccharide flippase family protein [Limosilactobacillus oris]|uniref:oligosaccharide flippase family protein n=1 Tax=Limosilactobacillus oris TaxID=1632 RepID=UPI001884889E|nr:oligosaccharide flippase family protein [Limosilactobacillus oris]MBF0601916.1 oligosaccharide flippase family protein [Limosilactobacillus oris]
MSTKTRRARYLAKNTFIFTLGNIGSKLISFFLLPLYTNCLTTSQYGTVDLITTIATVAVPMITLDIGESLMRFGLDKDADRSQNTQISILILLLSFIITFMFTLLLSRFTNIGKYSSYIFFYMISFAACQVFQSDLRGKELLLHYSLASMLVTFFVAIFNILFLLVFRLGIEGYLLAYGISNFLVAIYCLVVGKGYRSFGFKLITKNRLKEMVSYSFALIPNTFMWWITDSSDRILVTSLIGAAANGIYAVSYKLPTIVSSFASVFNQAWLYSAVRESNSEDESSYNNDILRTLTAWSIIVGLGVLAFTKLFLKFLVTSNYYEAWKYTPFLVIGVVYMTLGTFIGTSYSVHKDSVGFLISGMFGAIINVVLNLLMIKHMGVYGSALATCISYLSVFIFRFFHTQKYLHYRLNNIEFICGSLFLIISSCVMFIDNYLGFLLQILCLLIAVVLFSRDWLPLIKVTLKKIRKR